VDRAWLGVVVALVALSATATRAAADEPLGVVVRVAGADDDALLERVRGQTSDLAVTLTVWQGALEPSPAGRRRAARARAAAHGARVVVWFEPRRHGVRVLVADVQDGRLLARDVDGDVRGPGRTVLLEAAAQVVRSALESILDGQPLADSTALGDAETPPPPDTTPPAPPPRPRARRWYLPRLSLGLAAAHEGAAVAPLAAGRLGLSFGRVEPYLALDHFVAYAHFDDADARLELSRVIAAAGARLWLSAPRPLGVVVAARAGAVLYGRHTLSVTPPAVATPDASTITFTAGADVSLVWAPSGWLGVAVEAGVDLTPGAPTLGVDNAGQFVTTHDLWTIQPRLGVFLVVLP
jgi:hypothetical protein